MKGLKQDFMNQGIISDDINLGKYFYKLAELSQDVFWIRDIDYTTQLYISPAYERVWGLSCESLYKSGVSWLDTVYEDDKENITNKIKFTKNNPIEGEKFIL